MTHTALSLDTSPDIERWRVESCRQMSAAQEAAMVTGLTRAAYAMTSAGVRQRHPDAMDILHTIRGSIASSFAGEPRSTVDIDNRLEWHHHGPCGHTIEHRPWSLVVVVEFPSEEQALRLWMDGPPEPAPRTLSAPGASPTTPPI